MIAAGFGCRRGCAREDLVGALAAALERAGIELSNVTALYAPEFKAEEGVLSQVAQELGKPLVLMARAALAAQSEHALTRSAHSVQHTGLPSVAETAALAGACALAGRAAHLLGPRQTFGGATCALAAAGGGR